MERRVFLEPDDVFWRKGAVFNPTAIKNEDGSTSIIYRAIESHAKNYSRLGIANNSNGILVLDDRPFLEPTEEYEKKGTEDPRIARIDGTYHLLYTAWNGKTARVALASGSSINDLTKRGIVSPDIPMERAIEVVGNDEYRKRWKEKLKEGFSLEDKDAVLFPEKIGGKYVMLHRLEPDIQVVYFDSFEQLQDDKFWEKYLKNIDQYIIRKPKYNWESVKIGAGATPIKTKRGWLIPYHGVEDIGGGKLAYHSSALLASYDLSEIKDLSKPLFSPEYEWEKKGDVNNVVFWVGSVLDGDFLEVYYGAADKRVGYFKMYLEDILNKFG